MLPKQPHAKNGIWSQRANAELMALYLITWSLKLACHLQGFQDHTQPVHCWDHGQVPAEHWTAQGKLTPK